jgi:hypothetical protein
MQILCIQQPLASPISFTVHSILVDHEYWTTFLYSNEDVPKNRLIFSLPFRQMSQNIFISPYEYLQNSISNPIPYTMYQIAQTPL